jgi:sec-independent protein translocase protein TatC
MALVPFPRKSGNATAETPDPDWDNPSEEPEGAGKMSFLEHLDELRRRIIYSLLALVAGVSISAFFLSDLYDFVMVPMQALLKNGQQLIYTEPTEGLMLWIKILLIAGVLLGSPAILAQVWLFIAPGLYQNEKKLAIPFVVLGTVMFVSGAAFAHYIVFPLTWVFMASFSSEAVTFMPRIEPAFSLWLRLVLLFGAIFQMPTLVLFLSRMGLITARFLIKNMKYAILIMFIVGAVLSPGTDPLGQVLMAGPMFLLYCISIGMAWLFGKKKRTTEEA